MCELSRYSIVSLFSYLSIDRMVLYSLDVLQLHIITAYCIELVFKCSKLKYQKAYTVSVFSGEY